MPIYTSAPTDAAGKILPHELVSKKPAKEVQTFAEIKEDAYGMLDILDRGIIRNGIRAGAVALSHCQVAMAPFKFFVLDRRFKHLFGSRRIIVNAKIVDQSDFVPFREGCLTYPGRTEANTRRFRRIEVEYQVPTSDGQLSRPQRHTFSDFPAMILQHEIDHSDAKHIYDDRFAEYNRDGGDGSSI